jgi:complement component 1 Q subcomponent-binding protein
MSSGDVAKIDKSKQKLAKAISREIKFEEENYRDDESVNKFLQSNGFELKDNAEENTVELSKKVGSANVQVVFQSRPPQFGEEPEEGQEEVQKNQDEEGEGQFGDQNFADFTVYIAQSNGKALAFECTSYDSEININFVSVVNDVEAHKEGVKLERISGYSADFSILDERLQTGFLEYLKGFGINEDVALFVEHYSQDKDQRQYMQWLKDVNDFVGKPL